MNYTPKTNWVFPHPYGEWEALVPTPAEQLPKYKHRVKRKRKPRPSKLSDDLLKRHYKEALVQFIRDRPGLTLYHYQQLLVPMYGLRSESALRDQLRVLKNVEKRVRYELGLWYPVEKK